MNQNNERISEDIQDVIVQESKSKEYSEKHRNSESTDLLTNYFSSIRRFPLLNSEQETTIGKRAKAGDRSPYIAEGGQIFLCLGIKNGD